MICNNCPCLLTIDEPRPYGDTTVYEQVSECGKGLNPAECLADSHHTVRSYNRRDEEQDEWGDIQGHLDREDGR